ncbi:MAG: polysaccharide deacetylase family protein [Planctomycetota bacterium]
MGRRFYVNFHGLGSPDSDAESSELPYWIGRDEFEEVLDGLEKALGPRLGVTFDDGFRSDLEIAVPALQERGLDATFFVLAGLLGDARRLDRGAVREIRDAGFTIGSHGWDHRKWRGLDLDVRRREMHDSRRYLEDLLGEPVTSAACPFGSYDRAVLQELRGSGYRTIYTSDPGWSADSDSVRARNTLTNDVPPEALASWISRRSGAVQGGAHRIKRWVKARR